MIVIKPLEYTGKSVWASNGNGEEDVFGVAAIVCREGLERALNIELPKKFTRIEIDVEVTRFEYE